jgi:hypothetical protein
VASLVDTTSLLNEPNINLQGNGKLLSTIFSGRKALEMKVKLINKHGEERNLAQVPSCSNSRFQTSGEKRAYMVKAKLSEIIQLLQNEF